MDTINLSDLPVLIKQRSIIKTNKMKMKNSVLSAISLSLLLFFAFMKTRSLCTDVL